MKKIETTLPLSGLKRYEKWKSTWKNQEEVDEFSYISSVCYPEDCLIFCKLLFPDFILVMDSVFLEQKYDQKNWEQWKKSLNNNRQLIEKTINHTHLYDIFEENPEDIEDAIFKQIAERVLLSWTLILKKQFPDRDFHVEISDSEQDYGPTVTSYQK
ncbi:hypothetical protein RRX38_14265 [Pseudomonas sp. DTU_2021_1001937_2_SI_NGA_ILE_001]|uniref:hypothetical protein n=1 Tax=Pseudomonas sp. DTU_2021_1001937_2_SI_NGA_ILE_001 TaxID=3077589 RepID=UPI0028FC1D2D|nr:hypothetical protein [Pseudomonas sp. DTU_2021_1001937_2_SI_NGA_ILE_001]WNW12258.1 hypothetical protein RRX38_14265 [Pseudomonas sp. DTU_2021_1001937_2_SI_NGA_ILE_001]